MAFKPFSNLAQSKLSTYTEVPSNYFYWKVFTQLVGTLGFTVFLPSGHPNQQSRCNLFCFPLLYSPDIYWNFWETKCLYELYEYFEGTKNRVLLFLAPEGMLIQSKSSSHFSTRNNVMHLLSCFNRWNCIIILIIIFIYLEKIKSERALLEKASRTHFCLIPLNFYIKNPFRKLMKMWKTN